MKTKLYPHQFLKALVITGVSLTASSALYAQNNSLPATGNVGIGTTQPDQKLTVHGELHEFDKSGNLSYNNWSSDV